MDPITSLGSSDWSNYGVSVRAQIVAPRPAYAVGDPFIIDPDTTTGLLSRNGPTFPPPGWTGDPNCQNCTAAAGAYAGVCACQVACARAHSPVCTIVKLALNSNVALISFGQPFYFAPLLFYLACGTAHHPL